MQTPQELTRVDIRSVWAGEARDFMTRALAYAVVLRCRAVVVIAENHRDEFVAVADE